MERLITFFDLLSFAIGAGKYPITLSLAAIDFLSRVSSYSIIPAYFRATPSAASLNFYTQYHFSRSLHLLQCDRSELAGATFPTI